MVGYTGALAAAAWLGSTDGKALITKDGGRDVFGANYPGPIWRQFMVEATAALKLDKDKYRFREPAFPEETRSPQPPPSPATSAPATPTAANSATPTCQPANCRSPRPSPSRPASPSTSPKPPRSPAPSPSPTPAGAFQPVASPSAVANERAAL
jgi:membrane peptidoglycan carboxypeptidase